MSENLQKGTQSLMKAAWLIALITVFSKFIGFFRDIVIANFYGAGLVSDSYFYAYQIPSLALILLGGVGGPFHSAVVAVFSKLSFCKWFWAIKSPVEGIKRLMPKSALAEQFIQPVSCV